MCELYQRPCEIYAYSTTPMKTFRIGKGLCACVYVRVCELVRMRVCACV